MDREIRHPYQILDANELIIGQFYMLVSDKIVSGFLKFPFVFGGIVKNSNRKYNTNGRAFVSSLIASRKRYITIHMDGWNGRDYSDCPTLIYWQGSDNAYDFLSGFIGPITCATHLTNIIVPEQHWLNDPKVYDGVVERHPSVCKGDVDTPADWEKKMKLKRDAAMAKAIGF